MKKKIIFIVLIILLTGCVAKKNSTQPTAKNMDSKNKKVLMVVAPVDFRDQEYLDPRNVLEKAGIDVKVASIQRGVAKGADGTDANIDLTIGEANVEDFDAVLFVGGPGMAQITDDESLQVLAYKFFSADKLTTAICVAPSILAKAGILKDKKATAWSGSEEDLGKGGAIFKNEAVVQDGKIITANGPEAAKEFGEKIVEALKQ